jgi:hypothetical protein
MYDLVKLNRNFVVKVFPGGDAFAVSGLQLRLLAFIWRTSHLGPSGGQAHSGNQFWSREYLYS